MVQKRLYISEQQDRALKHRAAALGISEAELIRQALDELLRSADPPTPRREELDRLLDNTRRLAQHHRVPAGYCFRREALYEERETRLGRRPGA